MAEKRPLCQYSGQIEELRSGDTLPGGGAGGSAVLTKTLSQPGTLIPVTGTVRWYPTEDATLVDCVASVGTASLGEAVLIAVKKNGFVIASLTIPAGEFKSSVVIPSDTTLLTTDYLTVDVSQVGSSAAKDMNVQIQYTKV